MEHVQRARGLSTVFVTVVLLGCGSSGAGSGDGGFSPDAADGTEAFTFTAASAWAPRFIDGVPPGAGKLFVSVEVTIGNDSVPTALPMAWALFSTTTETSLEFDAVAESESLTPLCGEDVAVAAGDQDACRLVFEVPNSETLVEIVYDDGAGHRAVAPFPDLLSYPPGPYGVMLGATIEDLGLTGRQDDDGNGTATDDPVRQIHLADYHGTQLQVLMIAIEAAWVGPSQFEQQNLVELFESKYEAGGLVAFLIVLVHDAGMDPAEISDVDAWATTYDLPFDIAVDPDETLFAYTPLAFPSHIVIRLSDMTIAAKPGGMYVSPSNIELETAIDAVLAAP